MLCACAERQDRLEAKLSDFLQEDLKFMVAEVMVGGQPSARVDSPFYVIRDLRFFEGKTQMEVAEEIGISQAQVSRLEKSAIDHMKKYM